MSDGSLDDLGRSGKDMEVIGSAGPNRQGQAEYTNRSGYRWASDSVHLELRVWDF